MGLDLKHPLDQFQYCPKCGSTDFVIEDAKAKHCQACDFTYYFNPSAAVAVIISDRSDDMSLLVAVRGHNPARGTLDLVGGFVDCDETGEEAALREIREETPIRITETGALRYLMTIPNIYMYSGFEVHTLDMIFHLQLDSIEEYVGPGNDDVSQLVAIKYCDLDPQEFGLDSIQKCIAHIARDPKLLSKSK